VDVDSGNVAVGAQSERVDLLVGKVGEGSNVVGEDVNDRALSDDVGHIRRADGPDTVDAVLAEEDEDIKESVLLGDGHEGSAAALQEEVGDLGGREGGLELAELLERGGSVSPGLLHEPAIHEYGGQAKASDKPVDDGVEVNDSHVLLLDTCGIGLLVVADRGSKDLGVAEGLEGIGDRDVRVDGGDRARGGHGELLERNAAELLVVGAIALHGESGLVVLGGEDGHVSRGAEQGGEEQELG
jgi:hypothetical protein